MMIAMATAASAAAIAMMISVKKCPWRFCGYRYLLKATKFIFTEFRISSIDISMVIRFLRVRNPYTPIKNMSVLIVRKYCSGMEPVMEYMLLNDYLKNIINGLVLVSFGDNSVFFLTGNDNSPDKCCQQQDRDYFEWKRKPVAII